MAKLMRGAAEMVYIDCRSMDMAKLMRGAACVLQLLLCMALLIDRSSVASTTSYKPAKALFIFGDSYADVGNNNYIAGIAKANRPPYGIDFPNGPTGRFTNGRIVMDLIAELINLPYPPPYLDPTAKGEAILQGVNYASAAAGYLHSTGFNFIGRADFDTQLDWFNNTVEQLKEMLGEAQAQQLLAKSLFIASFGGNDYANNYLLSYSPLNKIYKPTEYRDLLLQKASKQITKIYNLGGKTIGVPSVGPLGCIPSQLVRQRSVNGECSDYVNNMVMDFNTGLDSLIQRLNQQLPDARIVYVDVFHPALDMITNHSRYGFKYGSLACCGAGEYNGQLLCLSILKPCPDRADYVFWDAFHTTEAANKLIAKTLFETLRPALDR